MFSRSQSPALAASTLVLAGTLAMASDALAGANEWTSEGPFGGSATGIATNGNGPGVTMVSTEQSGLWRLGSDGAWISTNLGLTSPQILSVTSHPSQASFYAVTAGEVLVRQDGGAWTSISQGLLFVSPSGPLAIDPENGTTFYLGTQQSGVFKSTDSGGSWNASASGLPRARVTGLAVDPSDTEVIYAALDDALFWKSTDAGETWSQSSLGLNTTRITQLILDPHQPDVLYAATPGGIFRTADGGGLWSRANDGIGNQQMSAVAVDPRKPGFIYAGSFLGGGVYRSTDDGISWARTALDREVTTVAQFAFDANDPDRLFFAERRGAGLFESTDGGLSWRLSNQGLRATIISDLAVDPSTSTAYAATPLDGIQRATLDGAWEPLLGSPRNGFCCDHVVVDPQRPERLFAGGEDGIHKSLDGGQTWQRASNGLAPPRLVFDLVIDPSQPDHLYLAAFDGIYRTTDGGDQWLRVASNFLDEQIWGLAIAPGQPATLVAGATTRLFRSTNGGSAWTEAARLPPGLFVESVALDPSDPQRVWVTSLGGGVFRSTDGGETLSQVAAEEFAGAGPIVVDPEDSNRVFVGTFRGVWWSEDGGNRWQPFEGGIGNDVWVRSLALLRGAVTRYYAGSFGDGAYSLTRTCEPNEERLCLDDAPGDRRFAVSLEYYNGAEPDPARPIPLEPLGIDDGGIFYFFSADVPEMLFKIVDGCGFNDRYWVFAAAATTLDFDLTVRDTLTGASKTYLSRSGGQPAQTISDLEALEGCPAPDDLGPRWAGPHPLTLGMASDDRAKPANATERFRGATGVEGARKRSEKGTCVPDPSTLCVDDTPGDGRFAIRLRYATASGGGLEGDAVATPLDGVGIGGGGIFSFFELANPEALVKIVDGCNFNGHFWVFAAASTTLGFELTVEDTETGEVRTYTNPDALPAATVTDTTAFDGCGF